ncbi:glycosyltransferase family 4 protein [Tundrisphaera sp. TA3]|uniref:glycosyltransferase family 4 protein n=1 Tax=Tundrisphaera sp. TA3 TaxID=3435775 RepID=UPI003EBC18B6
MKFAMLTSFFGPHALGGCASFVDRLSRALARHGHEVHVIHCRDAFRVARKERTARPYAVPSGVTVHTLSSPLGPLSPLATHQTGRPGFKARAIRSILASIRPDVVHFHNLSLIGGPGLLAMPAPGAVKLMTAHEHWLVCPTHALWKHGRGVCVARECVRCCVQAKLPPQLWRKTPLLGRSLARLDALIAPSRSSILEHTRRGIAVPMTHLPPFLPDDHPDGAVAPAATTMPGRPYVAASGRLERIRGFQDVIEAMRRLPHLDLRIAGVGPFEAELRSRAEGMANVHFEGRLEGPRVAALFRGARAVAVPSLVYETFGNVALEAFAERTPVVVRELGALPEMVAVSGGGLVFRDEDGLVASLARLAGDDGLRRRLGSAGYAARRGIWSESEHLERYLGLIQDRRRTRRVRVDRAHAAPVPNLRARPVASTGPASGFGPSAGGPA